MLELIEKSMIWKVSSQTILRQFKLSQTKLFISIRIPIIRKFWYSNPETNDPTAQALLLYQEERDLETVEVS